jgi:integrase
LAKAGTADRKLADEKGLYLLVTTNGSKLWRLKYRLNGKEKKLALGSYPDVGLKDAHDRRDIARKAAEAGSDPAAAKREARIARHFAAANTFGAIAEEYIAKLEAEKRAAVTVAKTKWLLGKLSPSLGTRPIAEITPHELLAVLKATERAGHLETARRLRSFSSRVLRYAVVTARATVDPAQPLLGALVAPTAKHHSAIIDPVAFGGLLRAIEASSGQPVTTLALRFTAHVFQRPGEVRQAEWSEIDFDKAIWTIPAARMKQRQAHRVPLSVHAIAVLREAQGLSGDGRYVFPKLGSPLKPMCGNAINQALRRMGYGMGQRTDARSSVGTERPLVPLHRHGPELRWRLCGGRACPSWLGDHRADARHLQARIRRGGSALFYPHSFRDMLVRHAMALNLPPEARKAWSQNLGHSDVLTTFTRYGSVPSNRQGELIRALTSPDTTDATDKALAAQLAAMINAHRRAVCQRLYRGRADRVGRTTTPKRPGCLSWKPPPKLGVHHLMPIESMSMCTGL